MRQLFKSHLLCLLILLVSSPLFALDEIRLSPGHSENDFRHIYPHKILKLALESTVDSHGPFKIVYATAHLQRNRALVELGSGTIINVHEAPTRLEWEGATIPIRIPIRKGLLGYKLFFIKKNQLDTFAKLDDVSELKKLKAGAGEQWSSTLSLLAAECTVVTGSDYEGLFSMLEYGRFDYFPRGVNEIFEEFHTRQNIYPNMVIEPTKAMYMATPSYFFVSPKEPKIAERVRQGMENILQSGAFEEAFLQEFGDDIAAANLGARKVLHVDNPLLPVDTPLNRTALWFTPPSLPGSVEAP